MELRIDLPEEGWVQFKDPKSLKKKERDPIMLAMLSQRSGNGDAVDAAAALGSFDLMAALLVESWSLGDPPNGNPRAFDDLTTAQWDPILGWLTENSSKIFPNFAPNPDPESPTSPSKSSDKL